MPVGSTQSKASEEVARIAPAGIDHECRPDIPSGSRGHLDSRSSSDNGQPDLGIERPHKLLEPVRREVMNGFLRRALDAIKPPLFVPPDQTSFD